jgi:hypothetical protein
MKRSTRPLAAPGLSLLPPFLLLHAGRFATEILPWLGPKSLQTLQLVPPGR